jgi:acetyl esterase/lipase
VTVTPVGEAFPGALLARRPGSELRPAVIVLGGSEGGDWLARTMAPRLASYGYAVLGLPYYAPAYARRDDLAALPSAFVDIPVDRLDEARAWLATQTGIDTGRIAVYGVSKGAEFALLAATRYDWIDAVVAIVPTDVVWEGWGLDGIAPGTRASFSWRAEALPFVPYLGMEAEFIAMGSGGAVLRRAHDHGRAAHPERAIAARIPVERFRGALLVAGGMQDKVWASGPMAQNIAERRAEAGLATVNLVFHDAGHALGGHGWSPTTELDGLGMAMGGSARGAAHAQQRTWQATLALLSATLSPPPPAALRP